MELQCITCGENFEPHRDWLTQRQTVECPQCRRGFDGDNERSDRLQRTREAQDDMRGYRNGNR